MASIIINMYSIKQRQNYKMFKSRVTNDVFVVLFRGVIFVWYKQKNVNLLDALLQVIVCIYT